MGTGDLQEKRTLEAKFQILGAGRNSGVLGRSSHFGYVVNNHGDGKSPFSRVVGPLPNHLNGL